MKIKIAFLVPKIVWEEVDDLLVGFEKLKFKLKDKNSFTVWWNISEPEGNNKYFAKNSIATLYVSPNIFESLNYLNIIFLLSICDPLDSRQIPLKSFKIFDTQSI